MITRQTQRQRRWRPPSAELWRGLPFPTPMRNSWGPYSQTTMNAQPGTAAQRETGSTSRTSDTPEDPSCPSTIAGAPVGPSLMERILGLFRHRNGTSLREEIADALAEPAMGGESF